MRITGRVTARGASLALETLGVPHRVLLARPRIHTSGHSDKWRILCTAHRCCLTPEAP